jgi:hypothetical protein
MAAVTCCMNAGGMCRFFAATALSASGGFLTRYKPRGLKSLLTVLTIDALSVIQRRGLQTAESVEPFLDNL